MVEIDDLVSTRSLKEARRRLNHLEEVVLEEEGDVPAWIIAASHAVDRQLQEMERDDG